MSGFNKLRFIRLLVLDCASKSVRFIFSGGKCTIENYKKGSQRVNKLVPWIIVVSGGVFKLRRILIPYCSCTHNNSILWRKHPAWTGRQVPPDYELSSTCLKTSDRPLTHFRDICHSKIGPREWTFEEKKFNNFTIKWDLDL